MGIMAGAATATGKQGSEVGLLIRQMEKLYTDKEHSPTGGKS